jgi:hypothetical protein
MDPNQEPPFVDIIFKNKLEFLDVKKSSSTTNNLNIDEKEKEKVKSKTLPKKTKKKCHKCNKKIGLVTGITCRCSYTFCSQCRYPDEHNCTFDFKNHDRKILEKQNLEVRAEKLERI